MRLNEQSRQIGLGYLDELGRDKLSDIGYSYDDLHRPLSQISPDRKMPTVPWEVIIRPRTTWNRREKLEIIRVRSVLEKGIVRGNLSFLRWNYLQIVAEIVNS